jgi:tRNA uridine 5-carboxymethylaminomethyl modification enzyme
LLLRQDNADIRLTEKGRIAGLISDERYLAFNKKKKMIEEKISDYRSRKVNPSNENNRKLEKLGVSLSSVNTLADIMKFPQVSYMDLASALDMGDEVPESVSKQVEIFLKYEGYIKRQADQVEKSKGMEDTRIPAGIDYQVLKGLSKEARHKLDKVKPYSIGQASRIAGVNPADVSVLLIHLKAGAKK